MKLYYLCIELYYFYNSMAKLNRIKAVLLTNHVKNNKITKY